MHIGHNYFLDTDYLFNGHFNNCACHYRCLVFGGGGGAEGSPSKDEGVFNKWLTNLADALKRLAGKAVEAMPAIVRIVVVAVLSFLGKSVGFVPENTWALIVFVAGRINVWLMQRVSRK